MINNFSMQIWSKALYIYSETTLKLEFKWRLCMYARMYVWMSQYNLKNRFYLTYKDFLKLSLSIKIKTSEKGKNILA